MSEISPALPPDLATSSPGDVVFQDLQQLLAAAGATIALDTLVDWTPEQCDEASEWARSQAEAIAKDKPGHHTSVKWPEHVSAAHQPAAAPPAADLDTATTVKCPQCLSKASWRGPLTPDMVERTFTRGVDAASGLPNCPRCGTPTQLVERTPIEDSIETAASLLPDDRVERRTQQPRIPGLMPPFNFESALNSILDQRAAVRRAAAAYDIKHRETSKAKKAWDEEQSTLSTMEDDFADRRAELAAEAAMSPEDRRARGCSFEALTGTPCTLCRRPTDGITPAYNGNPAHLVAAAHVAARADDLTPAALVAIVDSAAHLALDVDAVAMWTSEEAQAVTAWLEVPSIAPRPDILGRAHVVGEVCGSCRDCGALLHPLAEARGLEAWPIGQLVGTDCEGAPAAAEPARRIRKRHATPQSAAKAKQQHQETERAKGKRLAKRAGLHTTPKRPAVNRSSARKGRR